MRTGLVLGVLTVALLAVPGPAAAPHVGGTRLQPHVALTGCPPGTMGDCTVTGAAASREILFFRFDLDADGDWEYPDQTGGDSLGVWTTQTAVTHRFATPSRGVCVQGWDGVSTVRVRGEWFARGPLGCNAFAEITPDAWSRNSWDRTLCIRFQIPPWLNPAELSPVPTDLEGLRASPWPFGDCAVGRWPREWVFLADRAELTRLLGPGTHWVHLAVPWAGMAFTAADTVTIR